MKKLISNYTFNPSAKTITFSDYAAIDLESLLLITNVTDNVIIYNFADPSRGGGVNGNTVTLTYDTTSMGSTDALQIYYEDTSETQMTEELFQLFNRFLRLMQSNATVDAQDRQIVRVGTIDGGTVNTVGTVTTVNTVSNMTSLNGLAGVDPRFLLMDTSRNTYANALRSKLIS
jgi:hypothetical protein